MNKLWLGVLLTLGAVIVTVVVGTGLVVMGGLLDVGADSPHSAFVYRLIDAARVHAIARRAERITPPHDLDAAERIRRGAGNYDAMCVSCHLSPGVEESEIRRGLYPQPPALAQPSAAQTDARQRFWIIKHGIKGSGMPAWSKGGMSDADIWDLVAFLGRLPTLSSAAYQTLVASSAGHSHRGHTHDSHVHDARQVASPDLHHADGEGHHVH